MERLIKVFIADTSQDFTELLRSAIEETSDLVVTGLACDGGDAYLQLAEHKPDVLVVDLLLPGLDGLSLLRRLKDEGVMPHTMVVTSFVTDRMGQALSRLGADDYLPKPCVMEELLRRIRELADPDGRTRVRDYELVIQSALKDFGIMPHLHGRLYLQEAVLRALEDRSVLHGITKILYPELAKQFHTNASCVERAMRSAVIHAWNGGSAERRRARFGATFDAFAKPPSNARFIAAVAEFIQLEFEKVDVWESR